jgi:hypothetical protein
VLGTECAHLVCVMGTQAIRDHGLVMSGHPESSPPLVTALQARGIRSIVILTTCEVLVRLEVKTSPCPMVYRPALTTPEIASLLTRCSWAKQALFVVAASVPVPATLRHAVEESKFSLLSLFVSLKVACQLVSTLTARAESQ